jgi:hypothetical protein
MATVFHKNYKYNTQAIHFNVFGAKSTLSPVMSLTDAFSVANTFIHTVSMRLD